MNGNLYITSEVIQSGNNNELNQKHKQRRNVFYKNCPKGLTMALSTQQQTGQTVTLQISPQATIHRPSGLFTIYIIIKLLVFI